MSEVLQLVSGRYHFFYLPEIKEKQVVVQGFPGNYRWYETQCYMMHELSSKQPVFIIKTEPLIEHEFRKKNFLTQLYGEGSRGFHSKDFLVDLWRHVDKLPPIPIPVVDLEKILLTTKD